MTNELRDTRTLLKLSHSVEQPIKKCVKKNYSRIAGKFLLEFLNDFWLTHKFHSNNNYPFINFNEKRKKEKNCISPIICWKIPAAFRKQSAAPSSSFNCVRSFFDPICVYSAAMLNKMLAFSKVIVFCVVGSPEGNYKNIFLTFLYIHSHTIHNEMMIFELRAHFQSLTTTKKNFSPAVHAWQYRQDEMWATPRLKKSFA